MNLILLFETDFVATDRVRLTDRRAEHVRSVHRAEPGRRLRVGLADGPVGEGHVLLVDAARVELEIVWTGSPPPCLRVTLVTALPRPKTLRRVVQTATAMGVKRLILLRTWRVEKSYWQSPELRPERLREQAVLGLEQACDTILPEIVVEPLFRPFVEDRLPALVTGGPAFVAHAAAADPCPRAVPPPFTLAVGPEGGFVPYEIAALRAAGFTPVTLGPRTLRVEQAVPALLGRLL
jgi:RsmE family RNA methyltransferase